MKTSVQKFVLFGATGDLSQRMLWPSLYHLCRERLVPPTLTLRRPPIAAAYPASEAPPLRLVSSSASDLLGAL